MNTTGEKYVSVPALTTALRESGVSVTESFVAGLLAAGAPQIVHRHRMLERPSRVLAWWKARPGPATSAPADPSP